MTYETVYSRITIMNTRAGLDTPHLHPAKFPKLSIVLTTP